MNIIKILIIIIIFIILNFLLKDKFSNILNNDLTVNISSIYTNSVEFTVTYQTPPYYSLNVSTDNQLTPSQLSFKPRPLLWLIDLSNSTNPSTIDIDINNFQTYTKPRADTQLLNKVPKSFDSIPPSPLPINNTSTSLPPNYIDIGALQLNSVLNGVDQYVPISGDPTRTSQTCSFKILATATNIILAPLVIDRKYALGFSLMNQIPLPTTVDPKYWQGIQNSSTQSIGISTTYTPFLFASFILNSSKIQTLPDGNYYTPQEILSISIDYTDL